MAHTAPCGRWAAAGVHKTSKRNLICRYRKRPHRSGAICRVRLGGVLGKWAGEETEPTDKLTLLSDSIASGESRTGLGWLPSALQHSILLIIDPALPSGPQYNPGQHPEALKRRSGRGSRQLILSRRPCRRFLADTRVSPSAASLLALVSESGPGCQKRPNRRQSQDVGAGAGRGGDRHAAAHLSACGATP